MAKESVIIFLGHPFVLILCVFRGFRGVHRCGVTLLSVPPKTTVLVSAAHCNYICKDSAGYPVETCCCRNITEPSTCRGVRHNLLYKRRFCPALTKLALDLHVNLCILYSFLLSVCVFSGLFFKAFNWMIYWLLTVVLAPYLSN